VYQSGHDAAIESLRDALGEGPFDAAWAQGAALSIEDAVAYAKRGRGERKRPNAGWESLTSAERDVVRLVSEGLANKDIAARLFISPRTVQTHLTHVYTKLGLTSRVQLVQEAARHTYPNPTRLSARVGVSATTSKYSVASTSSTQRRSLGCHRIANVRRLSVGSVGGVAGWRLVVEGEWGRWWLILPISDDDAGVRQ
jgi:DNA-binding CsgD family transcriptional regulator